MPFCFLNTVLHLKNMILFTIIFEYRGGTYVSQVEASNEIVAFQNWAKEIDPNEIKYLDSHLIKTIAKDSLNIDYQPVLLNGLKNTWCATWSGSGLVHIIETATNNYHT